jgi:hypothetical protein
MQRRQVFKFSSRTARSGGGVLSYAQLELFTENTSVVVWRFEINYQST